MRLWNETVGRVRPTKQVDPAEVGRDRRYVQRLVSALQVDEDVKAWERRFQRLAASPWANGDGAQIADLWWALTKRLEIDGGKYDAHPTGGGKVVPMPAPAAPARDQGDWSRVLERLEATLDNRHTYLTWMRPTRLLSDDGTVLVVQVPDESHGKWIERHYSAQLAEALTDAGRAGSSVQFQSAQDSKAKWTIRDCQHTPTCSTKTSCTLLAFKDVEAGRLALEDVHPALAPQVRQMLMTPTRMRQG